MTYWQPGSLVKLPWTYNFPTNDILFVSINFIESGSNNYVALASGVGAANLTALIPSNFTIEGQATLVFKNANLGHNGRYSLAVLLSSNTLQTSEVLVVILGEKNVKNFIIYTIKLIYRANSCYNFEKNLHSQSCCIP